MIRVMAVKLNHQAGDTAALTVLMLTCAMTVIWVSCHDIPNSSKKKYKGLCHPLCTGKALFSYQNESDPVMTIASN